MRRNWPAGSPNLPMKGKEMGLCSVFPGFQRLPLAGILEKVKMRPCPCLAWADVDCLLQCCTPWQTRGSNVRHSFSSHRMQIFNTSPTQPYKNATESHSHSNLMHSSRWFWRGLSKPISHHSTQATSEVSETLGTFPRFDSNNSSTRGMEAKNTPKEWCAQVPQELVREVVEPARNEDNQTMIH